MLLFVLEISLSRSSYRGMFPVIAVLEAVDLPEGITAYLRMVTCPTRLPIPLERFW